MKVLVPALGRINTQNRDGSEIRFSSVAKIWQKKGYEIHMVLPPREKKILEAEGLKVKYHLIPEKTKYEGENLLRIILIYFDRLVKALRFTPPRGIDLLYIPGDFLIEIIPGFWWKRKYPRAKTVVCLFLIAPNPFRGYRYGYQKGWNWPTFRSLLFFSSQGLALLLLRKFADKVLVLNVLDKQALEKRGLTGKVEAIDMGVDLNEFLGAPKARRLYDACFLGRLHPQKGIFDLIEIWKMVCQKKPGAKLAMIGGGSEDFKRRLTRTISQKRLTKNISFLGFKIGKEKVKILKQSGVFLLPSFYESWGMVAAEAMAAGLPVVAYNLPIFPKLFPKGMVRVPIGDKQAFTRATLKLLEDKGFYQRTKTQAEKQAKDYDWKKVAARELKVLRF